MRQQDVDRVQEFRKCIECFLCQDVCHILRDHHLHESSSAALPDLRRGARDEPARLGGPRARRSRSRTASASATSRAAAPRCARSTLQSPRTRSSRSRSGVVDRYFDPVTKLLRMFKSWPDLRRRSQEAVMFEPKPIRKTRSRRRWRRPSATGC
jgi:succinate dehydrogenase / fumarate reductase iron-sulfur subunit